MVDNAIDRSALLKSSAALVGADPHPELSSGPLNAAAEARKIAFDRVGNGEMILLISGFPSTRRSWNRLIPLLSQRYQCIPADLPSFGDSGFLAAPASTENVARVFHEFVVTNLSTPLHVVAHDFGMAMFGGGRCRAAG